MVMSDGVKVDHNYVEEDNDLKFPQIEEAPR